jgi:hypothetical protein
MVMNARLANNQIFIAVISVTLRDDLNMTGLRIMLAASIFLAIRADLSFGGAALSIGVRVRNLKRQIRGGLSAGLQQARPALRSAEGADSMFYSPIYARLFLPPIVSINSLTCADGGGSIAYRCARAPAVGAAIKRFRCIHVPAEKVSTGPIADGLGGAFECNRLDAAYLFERRQVAGAVPNAFLKAREKAASEL